MSQPIIEIVVSPTGQAKVETRGFAGSGCKAASQFITQALGQTVSDVQTAEFYAQPTTRNTASEGT